jgi:hypothetical protein
VQNRSHRHGSIGVAPSFLNPFLTRVIIPAIHDGLFVIDVPNHILYLCKTFNRTTALLVEIAKLAGNSSTIFRIRDYFLPVGFFSDFQND